MRRMALKAYRVYDKSEDSDYGMHIVFAATASAARKLGWQRQDDLGCEQYTDLRARREPWADPYASADHIPLRAYLENRWWWVCHYCDTHVSLDDLGAVTDDDEPVCEHCATQRGMARPDWATTADPERR